MFVVAATIDLIQFLLGLAAIGEVLDTVISIGADALFVVWLWLLGISIVENPRRLASMAGQALAGVIPIVNLLPELTIGVVLTIWITRSEDKGGIIGKAAHVVEAVEGAKAVGTRRLEKLEEARKLESGAAKAPAVASNTLDLKNKTDNRNQQQKQGAQNRSPASDREISTLKRDIERYQSELQQYQAELATKERYYKENDEGFFRGVEMMRSTRETSKQEEAKWFSDHSTRMTSFYQEINRIKSGIGGLKNLIPQLSSQVAELERKAGTAK